MTPISPISISGRRGLGFRLAALISLTVLLTGGGIALIMARMRETDLLNEAVHGAERFTAALEASGRYAMLRNQRTDLSEIVNAAGRAADIEAVRIINKGGLVVFSSRDGEIGSRLDLEAEACVTCHAKDEPLVAPSGPQRSRIFTGAEGRRILGFIAPVYNEPGCYNASCHAHEAHQRVLGVIDVQLSLAEMDARAVSEARRFWLLLGLWILALAVLFGLIGHAWVTRPIRELAERCRTIAENGPTGATPLKWHGAGEIEMLARAFTRMVEEIRSAQDTLERKVLDRTRRLREAEDQIIRAEKLSAVGTLAAGIAHEVNNPLTGIITFARLLKRRAPPESDEAEKLTRIITEAERCSTIISSFLNFSRPDEVRSNLDLHATVEQLMALLEPQFEFRNIRFERFYAEALPPITAAPGRIQQVLTNLVKNAVEAGAREVTVRVERAASNGPEREEGAIAIVVDDDGPGIPQETLNNVFDPFYTTKPVGGGMGLGLWISYRIAAELGGSIRVENRSAGGARFTFLLPVA